MCVTHNTTQQHRIACCAACAWPCVCRYAGYSDDPAEALKAGWDELVQRWNDWNPEDRNQTLAYSAGKLL